MKNNKGFTLVELMAVIVILAIIIGIAIPSSIAISNKTKEKMYDTKVDMVMSAAKIYAQENPEMVSSTNCDSGEGLITIQTLIDKGYIKKDDVKKGEVQSPIDNSSMNKLYICLSKNGSSGKRVNVSKVNTKDNKWYTKKDENISEVINPDNSGASGNSGNSANFDKPVAISNNIKVGDLVSIGVKYNGGNEIAELKDWYIIKADATEVLAVSKYVHGNYTFSGEAGYKQYVISIAQGIVNIVSTNDGIVKSARPMGYANQTGYVSSVEGSGEELYKTDYNMVKKALGNAIAYKYNTTTPSEYWVPSRYYLAGNANATGEMGLYYVDKSGSVWTSGVYKQESTAGNVYWRAWEYSNPVRVIISIDPNAMIKSGKGTNDLPYQIVSPTKTVADLKVGKRINVGLKSSQTEIPSLKDWYIIKASSTEVLAVSKYVYNSYSFNGEAGYKQYVVSIAQGINSSVMSSTKSGVVKSVRAMGYNGQTGYINSVTGTSESTGAGDDYYKTDYNMVKNALGNATAYKYNTTTASDYWVMSRDYIAGNANATGGLGLHYVNTSGDVSEAFVYKQESTAGTVYWRAWEYTKPVRVIISLDPSATVVSGEGTDASPYQL